MTRRTAPILQYSAYIVRVSGILKKESVSSDLSDAEMEIVYREFNKGTNPNFCAYSVIGVRMANEGETDD